MKTWHSRARLPAASIAASLLATMILVPGCASIGYDAEVSRARTPAQAGLVSMQALVPDIDLDIRYAGPHNFVGVPVDGYLAPRCYLLEPAARALAQVEAELRARQLRLRVFDCYRPVRAVRHFVAWARDPDDQRSKAQYYPNVDKAALVPDYIADRSGHSRGATVDLTLMQCDRHGERCEPLDMGTEFDFFDERAHTDAPGLNLVQRLNRQWLKQAMERQGFRNYPLEWWHYTLQMEPAPVIAHDAPVN